MNEAQSISVIGTEHAAVCRWMVSLFMEQWAFVVNGMDFREVMPEGGCEGFQGGGRVAWQTHWLQLVSDKSDTGSVICI